MQITHHAYERGSERMGLNKRAISRLANIAFVRGIGLHNATGNLKEFLGSLYSREGTANNVRVYSHKVFIFCGDVLITILPLPNDLKKIVNKVNRQLKYCPVEYK